MRGKAARTMRLLSLLMSAGIGYAFGRVHQKAADEGRGSKTDRFGLNTLWDVVEYLREKEDEHRG